MPLNYLVTYLDDARRMTTIRTLSFFYDESARPV